MSFKKYIKLIIGVIIFFFLPYFSVFLYYGYSEWLAPYTINTEYKSIYDKSHHNYLICNGQSFYSSGNYIYAYKKGIFIIADNRRVFNSNSIFVYIDEDTTDAQVLQYINEKFYDGQIKVTNQLSELSDFQNRMYNLLKVSNYPFQNNAL